LVGAPYDCRRQSDSRYQGAYVGLEQVRSHSSNVAHVVAYVVGNNPWVSRVVLRYPRLHLANQVRPHIGGLGKYPPANPSE
jgi:hypothetical protein